MQILSDIPCDPLGDQTTTPPCEVAGGGPNPPLFSIANTFQNTLDQGTISADLKTEFADQNIQLSDKAEVTMDTPGNRWTIRDRPEGGKAVAKYGIDDLIAGWFINENLALEEIGKKFQEWDKQKGTRENSGGLATSAGDGLKKLGTAFDSLGPKKIGALKAAGLVIIGSSVKGNIASKFIWKEGGGAKLWSAIKEAAFPIVSALDAISDEF